MIARLRSFWLDGKLKTARVVALGILAAGPVAVAQSAADTSQTTGDPAASLFKSKCAICHGEDGSGTVLGNRLHVKDLRSSEVQDKSSAELEQFINAGTGKMPAFKGRLDSEQIQKLIDNIRQFKPATH